MSALFSSGTNCTVHGALSIFLKNYTTSSKQVKKKKKKEFAKGGQ